MNMLTDSVPDSLNIAGTDYIINTDFRVWLKFETFLSEDSDDAENVLLKIKNLIFRDKNPPAELDEDTTERILWFYRCGKEPRSNTSGSGKEIFSYDYDDGYIVAAFWEQYRIDLSKANLHWWIFHSLMMSLSDSTEFVKIMSYRAIEISPKMSAEQRNFYTKMKKQYKLPINKEVEKQFSDIENALLNGEDIDNLL